jgi:hypothetical protein
MQRTVDKLKAGKPVSVPYYYLDNVVQLCKEQGVTVTVDSYIYDPDFNLDTYTLLPCMQ